MSKSYEKANPDVMRLLEAVVKQHHKDLAKEGVRVGVTMVECEDGPAVTHAGQPCAAKVELVTLAKRVHAPVDAIIQVDEAIWKELNGEARNALIDHEVTHLELVRDAKEKVKRAADGRPKIRLRPDDWMLTGFAEVVKRHGRAALEYQALRSLDEQHGQLLFDWARPRKRSA